MTNEKPKLLLVDDQSANILALEALLATLDCLPVTARSGHEALKHILRDDFAVILLDVQMPDISGFETARIIKQREKSRYIPILFITANSADEDIVAEAYSVGAVDYIRKPFNADILKSKVSVFLDLYRQRLEIQRQAELLRLATEREAQLRQAEMREAELRREQAILQRERDLIEAHSRDIEAMARKQRIFLREVLSSLSEGRLRLCDSDLDLPLPLPPVAEPMPLVRATLSGFRRQVVSFARAAEWPIERLQDFETAVGEAAMNAVVHGQSAVGQVHGDLQEGTAQIWIRDSGKGIDEELLHRATLEKGYTTAGSLGHGFWMMLKTADRIFLRTGEEGTTVVLEQGPFPPQPIWLQERMAVAAA